MCGPLDWLADVLLCRARSGVYACAVCKQIHPQRVNPSNDEERRRNRVDNLIHSGCVEKFSSLKKFLEFHTLTEERAVRKCPHCGKSGVKDDACTRT